MVRFSDATDTHYVISNNKLRKFKSYVVTASVILEANDMQMQPKQTDPEILLQRAKEI